jgi:polyketide biosynthesis enoyl-CoA hydratase PksI
VSQLVELSLGGPVATLRLVDVAGRNALSEDLARQFGAALTRAVGEPATRVVMLAGLPDVFCSGGTRDSLLADQGANGTLSHEAVIRAPLLCPLPVVAAMRGHAIGGGLIFGLYADLPVLSERSVYVANFLGYGFMPCMGVTWVLPERLGPVLGTEVLLGAARYRGRQLRERGAPLPVLPHDEVERYARELSTQVARAPRRTLEHAKAALAAPWRRASEEAFGREVVGHLETLRQPSVRQSVANEFGTEPVPGAAL